MSRHGTLIGLMLVAVSAIFLSATPVLHSGFVSGEHTLRILHGNSVTTAAKWCSEKPEGEDSDSASATSSGEAV